MKKLSWVLFFTCAVLAAFASLRNKPRRNLASGVGGEISATVMRDVKFSSDKGMAKVVRSSSEKVQNALSTLISETDASTYEKKDVQKNVTTAGESSMASVEADMSAIKDQLKKLQEGIEEMREMLIKYYTTERNITAETFLAEPYQFRREGELFEKAFEQEIDRFARAFVQNRKFVVGVIGSSVAAGHDNCAYDNYENQLNRLMVPIFVKAGMEFEVRNGGMTGGCGDSYQNQIWCFPHTVGEVDMIHYTWTYFEHRDDAPPFHEAFFRWTQMAKRRPIPLIMYANPRSDFPFGRHSKDDETILQTYTPFSGANILYMQGGLALYGYEKKGHEGKIGDKLHENVRYADTQEEFRRDTLGVVYRNWHPGPLQFQTLSDTLGFHMSYAILEAIKRILAESDPVSKWGADPPRIKLPEPVACHKRKLPCDTERHPICHNGEKPTWGEPGVIFLNQTDPRRIERGDSWDRFLSEHTAIYGIKEEAKLEKCKHLDQCGGWMKNSHESGWLEFLFPDKLEKGLLYFCAKGKKGAEDIINSKTIVKVNGKLMPIEGMKGVFGKCVQVTEEGDLPENTVMSISLPTHAKNILITHVMGI